MARVNRINRKFAGCRPGKHKGKRIERNKYSSPPEYLPVEKQQETEKLSPKRNLSIAPSFCKQKQEDRNAALERRGDFDHTWKEDLKFGIRVTRLGVSTIGCLLVGQYFSATIGAIKISFTVFNYIAPPPDKPKMPIVDDIELSIELVKAAVKVARICWK